MYKGDPFAQKTPGWGHGYTRWCDVKSMLDRVREFDKTELRAALRQRNLQKTVRIAVERRLRKLVKL